jgi:hypothetical protein
MSTTGTTTQGSTESTIRYIVTTQQSPNPETTSSTNPFGNIIRYRFPNVQSFNNAEVALIELYIFYSWYNITAAFGNNTFSYQFPTASGFVTFTVTIPDGFYSFSSLNQIFQQIQLTNGTYLINTASGAPVFFLFFIANEAFYRVSLFSNPVPANGAGFTVPANYPGGGPPTTAQDPILVILPTNFPAGSTTTDAFYSFSKLLGYSPGSYPTQTVAETGIAQSFNGQFPPIIESTSAVNVSASFVNASSISSNPQTFFTFSPNAPFLSQLQYTPPYPQWLPLTDGWYSFVDIAFQDDNGRLLQLQDPHITIKLAIRGK